MYYIIFLLKDWHKVSYHSSDISIFCNFPVCRNLLKHIDPGWSHTVDHILITVVIVHTNVIWWEAKEDRMLGTRGFITSMALCTSTHDIQCRTHVPELHSSKLSGAVNETVYRFEIKKTKTKTQIKCLHKHINNKKQ